jgi:hypothetical protein
MKTMKMLFFSSDASEVEIVSKEFTLASIPCEVREGINNNGHSTAPRQAELWIHDDKDCHRALMLCVQLGIGFSKRAPKPEFLEDLELAFELER